MALADYKSNRSTSPRYDYQVDANQPIESKLEAFKEFLLLAKEDCSVSFSTKELGHHVHGISSHAHSTSTNEESSIYIGLNADRKLNEAEYKALHQQWVDILDISLNLEERKRGESYFVHKRITRAGKKSVLAQFIDKYQGSQYDINSEYGGGTTLRVIANTAQGEKETLYIDYLPQLQTEKDELRQAFAEYTSSSNES
ncbi:hypothetical protein [Hymenobacter algoricola]|uniref:hypothetical protein n=1 Tax=Hymenobacter algoricola TaxID=486267 RepID=UPI0031F06EB1